MKHISLALAGVVAGSLALSAQAAVTNSWWSEDFSYESFAAMTNAPSTGAWTVVDGDTSWIEQGSYSNCATTGNLVLNTEGNDLTFTPTAYSGDGATSVTVVDADVFFVGSESEPSNLGNDVQFALFLKVPETENAANAVMVYISDDSGAKWVELGNTSDIADKSWHHVSVQISYAQGETYHAARVFIDGAEKTSSSTLRLANNAQTATGLNSVSFRGTGAVDNFKGGFYYEAPPAVHTFTASVYVDGALDQSTTIAPQTEYVGADITFGVPYDVDGKALSKIVVKALGEGEDVEYTVTDVDGALVITPDGLDFSEEDDLLVTLSTVGAEPTGESLTYAALEVYYGEEPTPPEPTGFYVYFAETSGDGTAADPYTIPSYEALQALQTAVAQDAELRSAHYIQTADIDFTGKPAFAGIGVYNATPTGGTPFSGTYDGQGYKISNVDFTQRNYGSIFNQVNGGTIKNLTVSNITCSAFSASVNSGEWGAAIVGNAGNAATLQNLVAEGTIGTAAIPATHNVAGIVIRTSAGGTGTLIDSCTNNATLYGEYTKAAGICALSQYKIAGGVVSFVDCANNGDIVMASGSTAGRDGLAGIIAYVDDDTVLEGCSNTGTFTSPLAAARIGELVGNAYTSATVRHLTDNGGNSGDSTKKMVNTISANADVTGFQYATVENGVATTITGSPVAGGEYLLEGNAAPVIALAADETVAFDTALGYTLDDTGITAVSPAVLNEPETVGTVTTYSAAVPAPTTWTVTFTSAHGTAPAAQTVVDGETATEPEALTEEGWVFNGWTLAGSAYDFTTPVTANIELVADWTEEEPPHPVEPPAVDAGDGLAAYNAAHGTAVAPVEVTDDGFAVNFVTTTPGTYVLMIATTVDGTYAESEITQTVTAEEAAEGALVTLTDENTTPAAKFYKIGWAE